MKQKFLMVISIAVSLVLLFTLFAGCASFSNAEDFTDGDTVVGRWHVRTLNGARVESILPSAARSPEITIEEDGKLFGFLTVNRFSGTLDMELLSQGYFAPSILATTRRIGPPDLQAIETEILGAIEQADRVVTRSNSILVLKNGNVELIRCARFSGD